MDNRKDKTAIPGRTDKADDGTVGEADSGTGSRVAAALTGEYREVPDLTLPELLRRQAARTPERTAVEGQGRSLSYGGLEAAAGRLAARLVRSGAGPERFVAVVLPRSPELVVALCAVLKSGAAYVPVDPDYPSDRIRYMLDDAAPVCVVTTGSLTSLLPASSRPVLIDETLVDGVRPDDLGDADSGPEVASARAAQPLTPRHPAYVIYTSGSTGRPKGVVVEHRSVVDYVTWAVASYPGLDGATVLHSPVSFDLTVTTLFAPLTAGGTLRVAELDEAANGDGPSGAVDFLKVTPSHLALLDGLPGLVRAGGSLVIGGEQLTAEQLDRWRRANPGVHVFNEYGPTEATVGCMIFHVPPGSVLPLGPVPIGRPARNTSLHVLDGDLEPVAVGQEGELCIAGEGLARGYLGRPRLTSERFVRDPSGPPDSRMYRTGDLVRVRADGELEFIGRTDTQVKVNGFRIETAEVESALCAVPGVGRAVVVAARNRHGDGYLAGFVIAEDRPEQVPAERGGPDPAAVRQALAARLPRHLVPARIERVESFPLTPNGKLDRAVLLERLADVPTPRPARDDDPLGCLWAEALGGPPPDEDTGFLEAGGHSLAAVRLIAAVERRWGIRPSLATILRRNISLAGLRALVPANGGDPDPSDAPHPAAGPPALSPQQRRLWIHQQMFPDSPAYNVVGLLEVEGLLDAAALQRAWVWLVARHEALRTTVDTGPAGTPVARVHEASAQSASATRVVLSSHAGRGWRPAVRDFAADIAWPVFRAHRLPRAALGLLLDTSGARRSAVVVSVDHMVSDQQTLDLLCTELAARYDVECRDGTGRRGQPDPAPRPGDATAGRPPTPSRRAREIAYWRERLKDAPQELNLSLQRPRPEVPTFRGSGVERELDPAVSASLRQRAVERRVTPAMLILACYARVLADWAGVDDLTIGVPVSGRESPQEHRTVGFFMRTLAVRLAVPGGAGPEDLLEPVADALLSAVEHGSLPFDELVEELGLPRDPARNPLFQVWFNDLTQAAPPTAFGGHRATPVEPPTPWSLFDAGLYVSRSPDDGYVLRLVHALDLWPDEVAREFLGQCADEVTRLAVGAAAGSPTGVSAAATLAPARGVVRTCTDLVARVLGHGRERPGAVAVHTADGATTYGELADRVRRVAGLIDQVTRAAPASGPVAVYAERHPDLPVAVLAAWFTGRPVLLLDTSHPDRWNGAALSAAGAVLRIRLGAPGDAVGTAQDAGGPVLRLDGDLPTAGTPSAAAPTAMAAGTVGHLLMTSGTTGTPEVVSLPSEALPEALAWYADHLGLDADDVFCFTTPPAHDPVFRDLLLPLVLGAAVHIPDETRLHPAGLPTLFEETGTTVWHTTATRARLVTAVASGPAALEGMRHVVFHGEPLRDADAAAAGRLCPGAEVHNLYGTTETPQASALGRWERPGPRDVSSATGTVAVAAVVPHRGLSIRTPRGEAGVGVPGELVVTGRGLALEYRGGSGRTPPRPVPGTRGDRTYRTGDLAYRTPDGRIVVLGRADRQIGVHGHRVEAAGIERVLAALPGVTDCVVAAAPDAPDRVQAWYVAPRALKTDALRRALRARLPQWAVPARFTRVDRLPVTANGKTDLRALLTGPAAVAPASSGGPGPRADLAALITREAEELVRERSGPPGARTGSDGTFFEWGLGSLDLVHLHQRLAAHGVHFALAEIFRFPSARSLAEHLAGHRGPQAPPPGAAGTGRQGDLAARRGARARLAARPPRQGGAAPIPTPHKSYRRNREE
ncbi:amino acid adenylation domain-containing protein [Streptomyces sp. NPDC021969]|uniref:amino acid adenylation domain-containing protein n=1 Tax=unclassified Streptomyces TaxID=2593676 RepID=UPI0033D9B9F7